MGMTDDLKAIRNHKEKPAIWEKKAEPEGKLVITELSIGRTFNEGNFESTRVDLTARLTALDDVEDFARRMDKRIISIHHAMKAGA
jgi:hypothetical protein